VTLNIKKHLPDVNEKVTLSKGVHLSGGALVQAMLRAKVKWLWSAAYKRGEFSSLLGAVKLAYLHLTGTTCRQQIGPLHRR